jgi:hypothetical protein
MKIPHSSSLRSFTFLPCPEHHVLETVLEVSKIFQTARIASRRQAGCLDRAIRVVASSTPHVSACSVDQSHVYTMSIRLFPSFPCLHARHLTQSPCTYFSVSSILQIRVSFLDKVSFFRAKTLFTRGTCCIQLDRHVMPTGMAWLMEQVSQDKYHLCPDSLTFRYPLVGRFSD